MSIRRVTFQSDGVELVGNLHLPDHPGVQPLPAVVLTGPFSGVKEQVTGNYAAKLAERGLAALAFDHRNWGESAGTPRLHENPTAKLADLRDAVSYLAAHPDLDPQRIGLCGICLGGAYAARHAAFDPRVKAVALIAAAYMDPARIRQRMGGDRYRQWLESFAKVAQRQFQTGEVEYWPAVAAAGAGLVGMPGEEPYAYYGTSRNPSPRWENRCTALSVKEELSLESMSAMGMLAPTPLLIVHGRTDAYLPPEDARRAFEQAGEPKEALWLDTSNHIDLYDNDTYVLPAVDRTAAWFHQHLAPADGGREP